MCHGSKELMADATAPKQHPYQPPYSIHDERKLHGRCSIGAKRGAISPIATRQAINLAGAWSLSPLYLGEGWASMWSMFVCSATVHVDGSPANASAGKDQQVPSCDLRRVE